MLGAIIGDIAGSRYEWNSIKSKNFILLSHSEGCKPTDDSVMTIAIANAILASNDKYTDLSDKVVQYMRTYGQKYPNAGYGSRFHTWLYSDSPRPYNSFGNGSAMRVSPCAYAASTLEEAIILSHTVTGVTHNHPEGIKGAEAVTAAIFLANHGKSIPEIRNYIHQHYYSMNFTLDSIRETYKFDVTCQGSVPQAIMAFLESSDFEDAIRNAISLGGDADTQAAIAGSIAEAYYGIPTEIKDLTFTFMDKDMIDVVNRFDMKYGVHPQKPHNNTIYQNEYKHDDKKTYNSLSQEEQDILTIDMAKLDSVPYITLKELFTTRNGYTPSKNNPDYWENGTIPWFRMEDIREKGHILSDSIQKVNTKAIKGNLFPENSIIIATSATIGVHALITVPSLANQRFTYLIINEKWKHKYNIKFLYYYCFKLDEWCLSHLNQGNFASVDMSQFGQFKFPILPLDIQDKIVHILDTFTQNHDKLNNELNKEIINRKKQYQYYMDHILCNSKNNTIMKLKDICKMYNGDRGKNYPKISEMVNEGIPFVNAGDITIYGTIDYIGCKKITREKYTTMGGAKLRNSDILYCLRGSTGKNGIYEKNEGTIASSLMAIRANDKVHYKYLYYLLNSTMEKTQRLKNDSGAIQANLSAYNVGQFTFPIPPYEEQNRIVHILDSLKSFYTDICADLKKEIILRTKQYEYYRDYLLTFQEVNQP